LDIKGQTIIIHNNPDNNTVKISTKSLTQGVYLVKVETDGLAYVEKLVISR